MDLNHAQRLDSSYLVQTYARSPVVFSHGLGAVLFDDSGREYLDMAAGISVAALGHANPELITAVSRQVEKLVHVSNLFFTEPQLKLAEALVEKSFAQRVFFTNSGSEANETAFKFARKWAKSAHGERKNQVLAFSGAFHGRSMGALSLTYKAAYRQPFEPLIPGVEFATFNDLGSLEKKIGGSTIAVFVEPVQGEGGVRPASLEFLQAARELCDRHEALLIFDEVQCGLGRTGTLWAHEDSAVEPDMMSLAKPLAGGLPIGATLIKEKVAQAIGIGDHGSTFGGGPVPCAAGLITLEQVSQAELLKSVREKGKRIKSRLASLQHSSIKEIRGRGLLLGLQLDQPVRPVIERALARGLIVINAGQDVIRLCPPLTISNEQIDRGLEILGDCL